MLNRYKKYDRSFMEVILEVARQKVDFTMASPTFQYLIDRSYAIHYLHHPLPNSEDMDMLLTMLHPRTAPDDRMALVKLPIHGALLDIPCPMEQHDMTNYLNSYTYDPFIDYPLLFGDFAELRDFFMSDHEEVRLLLFSHLLLFPTRMDWLVWFDDDMQMVHLMAKSTLMASLAADAAFARLRKE